MSDRPRAAIANSALYNARIITPPDKLFVIDKNKLKQRNKYRQEIKAEGRFFELVNGIYIRIYGRQDVALVLTNGKNSKTFMKTTLKEHYVLVCEPEGFYLDCFSLPNGINSCSSHTHCYKRYRA